jgi:hypothetical protein
MSVNGDYTRRESTKAWGGAKTVLFPSLYESFESSPKTGLHGTAGATTFQVPFSLNPTALVQEYARKGEEAKKTVRK